MGVRAHGHQTGHRRRHRLCDQASGQPGGVSLSFPVIPSTPVWLCDRWSRSLSMRAGLMYAPSTCGRGKGKGREL